MEVIDESDSEEDDDLMSGDPGGDPGSSPVAEMTKGHVCVMCGKSFQHQSNLRVHIQGHLGSNAKLNSCQPCQR